MLLESKVMRKNLLTSALAVIALTASAQSQIASPAGEFDFITKKLTVGQKIIPMSMVKDGENSEYKFTVYDTSFNIERSFSIPRKQFKYNVTVFEAKAPIAKKTILEDKVPMVGMKIVRTDKLNWDGTKRLVNKRRSIQFSCNKQMSLEANCCQSLRGSFVYMRFLYSIFIWKILYFLYQPKLMLAPAITHNPGCLMAARS